MQAPRASAKSASDLLPKACKSARCKFSQLRKPLKAACLFCQSALAHAAAGGQLADNRIATTCQLLATFQEYCADGADSFAQTIKLHERGHREESLARAHQVIKGNWQLSGGHKGDSADDRTAGSRAVRDFQSFVDAGITTLDTADIYGPSEKLIGDFVRQRGGADGLQILTKSCKFGQDLRNVSQKAMSQVHTRACYVAPV